MSRDSPYARAFRRAIDVIAKGGWAPGGSAKY
jgi:hypothetical protein